MSNRDTWKSLGETVPCADGDTQKVLGLTSAEWRQATLRDHCARSLWQAARSCAETHVAAAADVGKVLVDPLRKASDDPHVLRSIKSDHEYLAKKYFAIADAHKAIAQRARAEAAERAKMLINKLVPRLVQQRLSALDSQTAAVITRLFGDDLADPRTRARVFEVCDFVYFDGGDEDRLSEHESIPLTREYV